MFGFAFSLLPAAVAAALGAGSSAEGTAAGVATVSGTITAIAATSGSAAGVATTDGTATGTGTIASSGSVAGDSTASGALTAVAATAGLADGAAAALGISGINAIVEAHGTAAGIATVSGVLRRLPEDDSPGFDLQKAIVGALKASSIVGSRVYDRVPQNAIFPLVSIGEVQVIDDDTEDKEAVEVFVTIHTWSRQASTGGKPETMRIQAAIRRAIHDEDLFLDYWALVEIRHRDSRAFLDADGETVHGVCTYRALMDAP